MIYWPAKPPGAVLDYEFDWTGVLRDGEQIQSYELAASGVTIVGAATGGPVNDGIVKLQISAGSLGTPGIVSCKIVTNSAPARTDFETAILPIGEEPVSLAMARAQCRAEETTVDDDYLLELTQAAREHVEAYCGSRIAPAAVALCCSAFAELERLGAAPVQSVTAVQYLDASGALQTLDPTIYELVNVDADPLRPRIRLAYGKSWPATRAAEDAVRVSGVFGYTVAPKPIVRAMLLLIGQWYDNRAAAAGQAVQEMPNGVAALLSNYRR